MMKYRILIALVLIGIGAQSQTNWTNVGNGLQQRVISGKTQYRFTKISPYSPFAVTDSLNGKISDNKTNAPEAKRISVSDSIKTTSGIVAKRYSNNGIFSSDPVNEYATTYEVKGTLLNYHSNIRGYDYFPDVAFTDAPYNSWGVFGAHMVSRVGASNTQDWTSSAGINGLLASIRGANGATGTIYNANNINLSFTQQAPNLNYLNHRSIWVQKSSYGANPSKLNNEIGIAMEDMTLGLNSNIYLLTGTSTSPGGNWGWYHNSTYNNYLGTGNTLIGSTADVGAKLQVTTPATSDIMNLSNSTGSKFKIKYNGIIALDNIPLNPGQSLRVKSDNSGMEAYAPATTSDLASAISANNTTYPVNSGGETLQSVTNRGLTTTNEIRVPSIRFQYNPSQPDSRSWVASRDVGAYGDFSIGQSTTQTGSTFDFSKFYIAPNGNTGIGTYLPTSKLDVNGNSTFRGQVVMPDMVDTYYGTVGSSGVGTYYNSSISKYLMYRGSDGSNLMAIDPVNARLGFGTTTPSYKLVVSDGGNNGLEIDPSVITPGATSILSYNRVTSAFTPLNLNASAFNFSGGNVNLTGALTASNMYSTSGPPTGTLGASTTVGTGATISVVGNNQDGVITLVTGTSITTGGLLFTITLNGFSYPTMCVPVTSVNITAGTSNIATAIGTCTSNTWTVQAGVVAGASSLQPSTTYKFNYHNGGY